MSEPDVLYFLAGSEAAATVSTALDELNEYVERVGRILRSYGMDGRYYGHNHRFAAGRSSGELPLGWRRMPRKYGYPKDAIEPDPKTADGKAIRHAIGVPPSWSAIEDALGIERTVKMGGVGARGGIRFIESSYGAERIGGSVVVVVNVVDGKPFGGAPKGCSPLARSAYWALREAADTALAAGGSRG